MKSAYYLETRSILCWSWKVIFWFHQDFHGQFLFHDVVLRLAYLIPLSTDAKLGIRLVPELAMVRETTHYFLISRIFRLSAP